MGKLIGTGKDPRFPKGQDYDVLDEDVQAHVKAGLGKAVESGDEDRAVHKGYEIIEEDALTESRGPSATQEDHDTESRLSARVETTSLEGGSGGSSDDGEKKKPSTSWSRDDLDARAREAGVEDPEDLPNKEAVIEATEKAEA